MQFFKPILNCFVTGFLITQIGMVNNAMADPPPWAPAHGYYKDKGKKPKKYKSHDDVYYRDQHRPASYINGGRCNREGLGTLIGGVVGGAAGSQVGKGDTRTAATIIGTIIGSLIGSSIGRSMDEVDQACVGQALEYAEDRQPVVWRNPDTGNQFQVTPTRTYEDYGRYCREFSRQAVINGRRETIYGRACRQQDGSWNIVR